jgi:hypothetical protein
MTHNAIRNWQCYPFPRKPHALPRVIAVKATIVLYDLLGTYKTVDSNELWMYFMAVVALYLGRIFNTVKVNEDIDVYLEEVLEAV